MARPAQQDKEVDAEQTEDLPYMFLLSDSYLSHIIIVIGQVSIPTLEQLKCRRVQTLPPHARGLVLSLIMCCAFV